MENSKIRILVLVLLGCLCAALFLMGSTTVYGLIVLFCIFLFLFWGNNNNDDNDDSYYKFNLR